MNDHTLSSAHRPQLWQFGLLLLIVGSAPALGQDDSAEAIMARRIDALVIQLGAEDYHQREQASQQLFGLGIQVLPAVAAQTKNDDPEIRYRAEQLVARLKPFEVVYRLEKFLRKEEDSRLPPLEGWQRFSQQFGDDDNARELFAQMYTFGRFRLTQLEKGKVFVPPKREPGDPVASRQDEDATAYPELVRRRPRVNNIPRPHDRKNSLPLGWIAVRVFIATEPEAAQQKSLQTEALAACFEPAWWEALEDKQMADLVRRLTARLIPLLAKDRPVVLSLAARFGLKESLPYAVEAFQQTPLKHPYQALFPIAAFGDDSHLSLIRPLLNRSHVVLSDGDDSIEMRDAALATMIRLSKEPITDYFTCNDKKVPHDSAELLVSPKIIGFSGDQARGFVHELWAEKHPELKAEAVSPERPKRKPKDEYDTNRN